MVLSACLNMRYTLIYCHKFIERMTNWILWSFPSRSSWWISRDVTMEETTWLIGWCQMFVFFFWMNHLFTELRWFFWTSISFWQRSGSSGSFQEGSCKIYGFVTVTCACTRCGSNLRWNLRRWRSKVWHWRYFFRPKTIGIGPLIWPIWDWYGLSDYQIVLDSKGPFRSDGKICRKPPRKHGISLCVTRASPSSDQVPPLNGPGTHPLEIHHKTSWNYGNWRCTYTL